jgi:hypothetical protein
MAMAVIDMLSALEWYPQEGKTKLRRWVDCWGGPTLVLAIILIGMLLATLMLRELRPCGCLDAVLRDGDGLCVEMISADSDVSASEVGP